LSNGKVFCSGTTYNCLGSSGGGSWGRIKTPVEVTEFSDIMKISTGSDHMCAIKNDNTVTCRGGDTQGQRGDGTNTAGSPYCQYAASTVSGISNAVDIGSGSRISCALLSTGKMKCWGANYYGQIGDGTTTDKLSPVELSLTNIVKIAVGQAYVCAVINDGTVKCWGYNLQGQLGDGTTTDRSTPTDVSGISNAVDISAGVSNTCAVLSDKTVKCWGHYIAGAGSDTGAGSKQKTPKLVSGLNDVVQVTCGNYLCCARLSTGSIKCWGKNSNGGLGTGSIDNTNYYVPSDAVAGIDNAIHVSCGHSTCCAVLSDATGKCWGENDYGMLGDDTTTDSGSAGNYPVTGTFTNGFGSLTTGSSLSSSLLQECSACPTGSIRAGGDFPADGATSCACPVDFHVSGGECLACVAGTRAAGDDPLAGDTHCTCNADHKVVSNVCTACDAGQERAAGDDAGGDDTTCLCKENYYSDGAGTCTACDTAGGAVLAAGSDPAVASQCQCGAGYEINGATCDACAATEESVAGDVCKCKENHYYDGANCIPCAAGSTHPPGDGGIGATSCTPTLCAENERLVSHVCTPCTTGMTRAAGDDATGGDTTCAHQGTAHKVELSGNFGYKIDSGTTNGKLVIRKGSGLHTFYRDSAGDPMRIVSAADCTDSECNKATYSTLPTSSLGLDDAEKDVAVIVLDPDALAPGTYYYMSTTNGYRKGRIIIKPTLCKDLTVALTSTTTGSYTLTQTCELDFVFSITVDLTITFSLARLRAQGGDLPTIYAKEGERHFHVSSGAKLSLQNIELKGGSPSGDGGAIKCDNCELEMDNVKMTDNTAGTKGGAIYVTDSNSKVTLSNTLFSGNQGTAGGALAIVDADTVTITDSDFNSNIAATGDGGAIESSRDITVSGTSFLENRAGAGDGGAIKMASAKLTATGSSFRKNRAKRGGAFKSYSGDVDFSNMVLEENEAVEDGGALDVEGSAEVDIRLTTMRKNRAKRGGAIRSKATAAKKFRIRNSALEENEAHESGGGGGVDLDGTGATKFMFQDSTMTGNTAGGSGNDFKKRGSSVKILAIDSEIDDAKIDGGTRDSECVSDQCTGRADSTCQTRTGGTTCECNSGKYLETDKACHNHKSCTGLGLDVQIRAGSATENVLCGSPDVAQIAYALDDKGKELAALVEKRLVADGVAADAAYALAVEVFGEVNKCE
jgi:predicted outer membrane repeat protein